MFEFLFPFDWYWLADDGRIYASARQSLIDADDADYQSWRDRSLVPTRWPEDDDGEQTDAALAAALTPLGLTLWSSGTSTDPRDYPLKRWQFQAMVQFLGVAEQIETAIAALPDPLTRAVALARYRESDVYLRGDPLVDQLSAAVGLTAEQVDAAWLTIARGV